MSRKNPKARRATALTLLTSALLVLAAETGALVFPPAARANAAASAPVITPSRRPYPGDPNTPDEGRPVGATSVYVASAPTWSASDWIKEFIRHFVRTWR